MEIRVYDANLDLCGITENQTSFLWTRRMFEPGEFQIFLPVTRDNIDLIRLGRVVTYRGANEAGVIEYIRVTETHVKNEIQVKGRFLESYMDRRLIRPTRTYRGTAEVVMRQMLTDAEAIPLVRLGDLNGFTDTIEFQATYKNLLAYETKLANAMNYGFRFKPDFTKKTITFEVFQGVDRTIHQNDRNRVIFSDKYKNIETAQYTESDQLLKTVGYVGGEGEGSARVYVTVGDTSLTGLERREVFIDARDVRKEDGVSDAQYRNLLVERGKEKMLENAEAMFFECSTLATGQFVYMRDYNLGDLVTVEKSSWGIAKDMRITELMEVYEKGKAQVVPTLGDPLPEKVSWEDN